MEQSKRVKYMSSGENSIEDAAVKQIFLFQFNQLPVSGYDKPHEIRSRSNQ
jgi:hypothetical protein